jgi:ribonucleoside-diphosphate reductase alpha chain
MIFIFIIIIFFLVLIFSFFLGLADCFILMRFPFDSSEAAQLNKAIFEAIYFAACSESCALAEKYGPYESFPGSPMSKGQFQFDLWGVKPSNKHEWEALRERIVSKGIRNSLLLAPMPTASTSQILGNNECFEPYTSNMYVRRTSAGEFMCVSKHLVKDLVDRNLWTPELKDKIIAHDGSVQNIDEIPIDLKALYKTAFEIKSKVILDMSADRGAFICQSQSLNIHMPDVNFAKLTSLHFYGWKKGLKTGSFFFWFVFLFFVFLQYVIYLGMYYLRTKSAVDAIKFTVDTDVLLRCEQDKNHEENKIGKRKRSEENFTATHKAKREAEITCSLINRENCDSCGS